MPSAYENLHQHNFLSQLIDFIHAAKLNKTTTKSLLTLLRSTNSFTTDIIPKTTNALWEQLGVKFTFNTFYFCSTCFNELHGYQDICSVCNLKEKANSELCVFSLAEEIERVVKSTINIIKWYSLPENQIVADLIHGKFYVNIFLEKSNRKLIYF
jgi:recombinational DNA repair protein RecR